MYLNRLEGKEREIFLDLAVQIAKMNGMIEDAEKELIRRCCREMAISEYTIYDTKTLDEAAAFLKDSKKWKKRIILLELIGIGVSDGKFNKKEKEFVEELAEKMGVGKGCIETLEEDVKEYHKIAEKISNDVFS